jgi:hypothetical protein
MAGLTIHNATNVTTAGVDHGNKNVITLTVSTDGYYGKEPHTITILGLPLVIADALEQLLGNYGTRTMTEAEIRADERRKIANMIDPAL